MKKHIGSACLITIWISLGFALGGSLWAQQPPEAQLHEVHLYPGIERVRLPLPNGLTSPSELNDVTTISPPSFGQLTGLIYQPGDEMWEVGADRLALQVTLPDGQLQQHTFLLSTLRVSRRIASPPETFESGSSWAEGGATEQISINDTGLLFGDHSLQLAVGEDPAWIISPTYPPVLGGGVTGYGGAGGTMIGPPDDPWPAYTVETTILTLGDLSIQQQTTWDLQGQATYCVQVTAPEALCAVCATPCRPVPEGPIRFRLWAGAKIFGTYTRPLTVDPWAVRFDLHTAAGQSHTDWLEGDFHRPSIFMRAGVLSTAPEAAGTTVHFDDLELWVEEHEYTSKGHRSNDFENGQLGLWEPHGPGGESTTQAISGKLSWSIDADALEPLEQDSIWVDTGPGSSPIGRISAGSALFRIDLKELSLADGNSMKMMRGSSTDGVDGGIHHSVQLQRFAGLYRVRAMGRDDFDQIHKAPWFYLQGNGPHDLAIRWRAASGPGENNGEISLWVNGELTGSLTGIDNDTKYLEAIAFGAHRPKLSDNAQLGKIILDDLATFPEPQ